MPKFQENFKLKALKVNPTESELDQKLIQIHQQNDESSDNYKLTEFDPSMYNDTVKNKNISKMIPKKDKKDGKIVDLTSIYNT